MARSNQVSLIVRESSPTAVTRVYSNKFNHAHRTLHSHSLSPKNVLARRDWIGEGGTMSAERGTPCSAVKDIPQTTARLPLLRADERAPGSARGHHPPPGDSPRAASSSSSSLLREVMDRLFVEVEREYGETGRLSDDLMSALQSVFHQPLLQAFDLIDRSAVTRFTCPSGREMYRVQGTSGRSYTCLPSSDFCSCPSFVYSVLVRADTSFCKHALAVRLARAMARCEQLRVTDEEMAELLSSDEVAAPT